MSPSRKVETAAEALARLDRELSELRAALVSGSPLIGHSHAVAHAATTGKTVNDHHNQIHGLVSSDHTVSGLTAGHVLQALTATTFGFAQLAHSALSGLTAGDPHTQYQLKTQEAWQTPTLINSWVAWGAPFVTAQYRRSTGGVVMLRGVVKNGTGAVMFVLPVGYRPDNYCVIPTMSTLTAGVIKSVIVDSVGNVYCNEYDAALMRLDGVAFYAA